MSLRAKLVAIFLVATLAPLGVTLWISTSLLESSLSYVSTEELDEISQSLEATGREFYQRARESLKADAMAGQISPQPFASKDRANWPYTLQAFADSEDAERFQLSGEEGNRLNYLVRKPDGAVWVYSRKLGGVGMNRVSRQLARARETVERANVHNLRRGMTYTLMVAAGAVWVVSLVFLIVITYRVSRPIKQLTAGLSQLAAGEFDTRISSTAGGEAGAAIAAFNATATQLAEGRERLIYVTRLESWQALARKMTHEVKNSLTPIRLTMEEILARRGESDAAFLEQAAQIVVDEVSTLERRVRAFTEFAAEPPVRRSPLDVNAMLEERVAFLRTSHPEVVYDLKLSEDKPVVTADEDLLKGVLTNLLENAAHAAGGGGMVRGKTFVEQGRSGFEIHDSGPGLRADVRKTLFEPSITFKKGGMGLGLSIARKSAVLTGGDIQLVPGELGGAAFRVVLPAAPRGA
jgi:two-component system nitrogen regulation sensor histidine kinase NtrY